MPCQQSHQHRELRAGRTWPAAIAAAAAAATAAALGPAFSIWAASGGTAPLLLPPPAAAAAAAVLLNLKGVRVCMLLISMCTPSTSSWQMGKVRPMMRGCGSSCFTFGTAHTSSTASGGEGKSPAILSRQLHGQALCMVENIVAAKQMLGICTGKGPVHGACYAAWRQMSTLRPLLLLCAVLC